MEIMSPDFLLQIPNAVAGAPTVLPQEIVLKLDGNMLVRALLLPIIVWLAKSVITYSLGRFHLIRNLYADIQSRVSIYRVLKSDLAVWKERNIPASGITPTKTEDFNYIPEGFVVYQATIPKIIEHLWGREVDAVHGLYRQFEEIEKKLSGISGVLRNAHDKEYPFDQDEQKALASQWLEDVFKIVDGWGKAELREIAQRQFIHWAWAYLFLLVIPLIALAWIVHRVFGIARVAAVLGIGG